MKLTDHQNALLAFVAERGRVHVASFEAEQRRIGMRGQSRTRLFRAGYLLWLRKGGSGAAWGVEITPTGLAHARSLTPGATPAALGTGKRASAPESVPSAGLSRGWEPLFTKMRAIEATARESRRGLNARAERALRYLEKRMRRPDLSS